MTKMSSINQAGVYCKTELKEEKFHFKWDIVDFQTICKLNAELYSSIGENNLKFSMVPKKDKVEFYCHISDILQKDALYNFGIKHLYSVFLNTNERFINELNRQPMHYDNKTRKVLLYTLSTTRKPRTYLVGSTFTILFQFHKIVAYNNTINPSKLAVKNTDISVPKEKSVSLVTFIINDQRLQADKNLLCSKSQVFEAMFNCGLKETANNEVEITDVKWGTLKELLCFVENGYLSNSLEWMDTNEIQDLFVVADKYDIQDLKLICEQYLIINTAVNNVVTNLKIAYLNNGKSLEKYAKALIKLNLKNIRNTSEFITLMQMYPELLTQIKNIQTFEKPADISPIQDK